MIMILGDLNSIAVFIWQSASQINKRINILSDAFEKSFNMSSPFEFNFEGLKDTSTS